MLPFVTQLIDIVLCIHALPDFCPKPMQFHNAAWSFFSGTLGWLLILLREYSLDQGRYLQLLILAEYADMGMIDFFHLVHLCRSFLFQIGVNLTGSLKKLMTRGLMQNIKRRASLALGGWLTFYRLLRTRGFD
jgi:hypothetical protein